MANMHWKQKEQFWEMISKRAKQTTFTQQSKQPNLQIDPKSLKAKKDSKTPNGPCDLGPKQGQTNSEWRNEQSLKRRSKTIKDC